MILHLLDRLFYGEEQVRANFEAKVRVDNCVAKKKFRTRAGWQGSRRLVLNCNVLRR